VGKKPRAGSVAANNAAFRLFRRQKNRNCGKSKGGGNPSPSRMFSGGLNLFHGLKIRWFIPTFNKVFL